MESLRRPSGETSRVARQAGEVMSRMAEAQALAGHKEEAIKLANEAYAWQLEHDRFAALGIQDRLARVYVICDRRNEAFAVLKKMMTEPGGNGPEALRLDPLWSRVNDDPRFEEILKSAKPL